MSIGPKGPRLRTAPPRIEGDRSKRVEVPRVDRSAKVKATIYNTREFQIWRGQVIARAGGRCEHVENGRRCPKAMPHYRMYADHRVELKDGGDPFNPRNGQCLCAGHHVAKTLRERGARLGRGS